jgi:hypothetical protein
LKRAFRTNCGTAAKRQTHLTVWNQEIVETDDPRWIAFARATWDPDEAAVNVEAALLEIEFSTVAGAAALLRYIHQFERDGSQASRRMMR